MGVRLSSGYISIAAALTSTIVWMTSVGKIAVIKKMMWLNRTVGNGFLNIGYLTNAVAPIFTPVMPGIWMVAGIPDGMEEGEIPLVGNTREGFIAETTAVTGSLGYIIAQTTCAAAAAPADVMLLIEIEET